jgi:DNA-binding transcriptional LysR family regulator
VESNIIFARRDTQDEFEELKMDFRHLSGFLAVAEELNFGRAAERLHISQPPLSRLIMELEKELGVALFVRGPRGVTITNAGLYLEKEAERILGRVSLVQDRIRAIGDECTRQVRIGFVASAMYSFLPELVERYCRELHSLSFEFVELATNVQAKSLLSGKIDIGFVRSWLGVEGIRFVPIAQETLSFVRSARLAPMNEIGVLSDYAEEPFIAFSNANAPGIAECARRACESAGFSPKVVFTAGQFDSVLRLVASGLGWSIVPTMALSGARLGLVSKELVELPDRIMIGAALREDEEDPMILSLLDLAERYFKKRPSAPEISEMGS